jgi:hypothetical protein
MSSGFAMIQQMKREIYDVLDLRLALLELNKQGFDLEVSADNAKRLHVTCKRTQNRFLIEGLGHNEWPHPQT